MADLVTSGNITQKELTISGSFLANNKIFDNTVAATIKTNSLTLPGIVDPDEVTLTPVIAFADAVVGTGKTVSLTAASSLAGADKANYSLSLTGAPTTTADIYSDALTITNADGSAASGIAIEGDQRAYKVTDRGVGFSYAWTFVNEETENDFLSATNTNQVEVEWNETGILKVTETYSGGGTATNTLEVTVTQIALKGTVKYNRNNLNHTPIEGITVNLKNGAAVLATTTTDATGYYEFMTVDGSTNTIEVSTDMTWGGGNSTDALAVQRRQIASYPSFYKPGLYDFTFRDSVGDVNANKWVNATDALLIKKRAIQLVSSFVAGDWAFYVPGDTLNRFDDLYFLNTDANTATLTYSHTGAKELNILMMAYGDVNSSYTVVPPVKTMTAVSSDKVIDISRNKVINLPVRLKSDTEIGAITLYMKYADHLINVKGIKTEIPGLIYNIADGYITVAWSNTDAIGLPSNGTIFALVLEAKGDIYQWDDLFTIDNRTQVADLYCNVLDNVYFIVDRLNTKLKEGNELNINDMYAINCYPNPVKEVMTIDYTLPENGLVNMIISNSVGESILKLLNQNQDAGDHTLQFNPGQYGLTNGVYYCRIAVNGEKGSFNKVVRIVYVK